MKTHYCYLTPFLETCLVFCFLLFYNVIAIQCLPPPLSSLTNQCNLFITTLEAVSDGLYVSPAIETADYHASLNKNSWFYVFDYQTKYGDYATVRCWTK